MPPPRVRAASREKARSNGYPAGRELGSTLVPISKLKPLGRATRKHSPAQIKKLAGSLARFGFVNPILVDGDGRVVAGWGLVLAARSLDLTEVPAITLADLGEADLRQLRLALNRTAEDSSWDGPELKLEFEEILQISNDMDLGFTGFETGEIDVILRDATAEEDVMPAAAVADAPLRVQPGDLWRLGDHRLLCGDALQAESYRRLMGDERAQMILTDPPWNIPIEGFVSGLGAVKHPNFQFACGEMSAEQFETFLRESLGRAAGHSGDGALAYVFMRWSEMETLLRASKDAFDQLVNLCVWAKSNGGMGSLYRSRHELVFVFKVGKGPYINNVALGRFGRNRSNVWEYPSANAFNGSAKSKLALHPTPKPVALVADAMQDASHRGGIVLGPFGGVGSTLIAAEKTGRMARLIEIEPRFADAVLRRWEALTGRVAERISEAPPNQNVAEGEHPHPAGGPRHGG